MDDIFIISEIRESGGYERRIEIHGYNPFGRSIALEINWEQYSKEKPTIGDKMKVTIEYTIQDG